MKNHKKVGEKDGLDILYPSLYESELIEALEGARKENKLVVLTYGIKESGTAFEYLFDTKGYIELIKKDDRSFIPGLVSFKKRYERRFSEMSTDDMEKCIKDEDLELNKVFLFKKPVRLNVSVVALQTKENGVRKTVFKNQNFNCEDYSDSNIKITSRTTKGEKKPVLFVAEDYLSSFDSREELNLYVKATREIFLS